MRSIEIRVTSLLAAVLLLSGGLFAQATSGNLTGTVYDPGGATVPGVTVVAHNDATGVDANTATTSTGEYRLPNLPVGTYTLTVEVGGFAKSTINTINVQLNQTLTQNVSLRLAQSSTTVEVSSASATIDTTTAQIQSTFETKQLQDLPITGGVSGVLNLSLLAAGVSTNGTTGIGTGPSIGGQRARNNNFLIEGIDNNNRGVTGPLVTVPNDDVAEFTLLQNQFSPEFGHSTGGQFNTVVRSGTNEYHGMLYDYFRNRNLNAVDTLLANIGTTSNPRYDYNRLGANLGGPILHNKLFFFAGFEYNPIGQAGTPGQLFSPTAAGYATLDSLAAGFAPNNYNVLKQYLGAAPTAADPASLPNKAYPTVLGRTIESGILPVVAPNFQNNYYLVTSMDYNMSQKDQVRGRYIYNRTDAIDNFAALPSFYITQPFKYHLVNLSEYHSFSPTVNNEFRLGFNRYFNTTPVGNQSFPGLNAFPNLTIDEYNDNIGPDPNAPQYTIINTYQLADNISVTKGAHSLKFGTDMRRYISPQGFTQRVRGDYFWTTMENYLLDLKPDDFGERSAGDLTYWANQWNFGFYGNDDWKIRPNLTINLGLRYEYWTLPAAEKAQALNSVSDVPGLITFHSPRTQTDNFMPRVGFAYSPGTSGATSFRGGFGIGYDVLFDNLGTLSLPPQQQQTNDVDKNTPTRNFLASGGLPASPKSLDPITARQTTSGFIPDVQLPKALQWNFGVQHVFAQNYTFEVRYLGTRGLNLPVQDRINVRSIVQPNFSLPTYFTAPTQTQLNALGLTEGDIEAAQGASGRFRPDFFNAGFASNITAYMPIGDSVYHGLATQVSRRFANGLQYLLSYTWSHNIDNSTAEVFSTVTTPRRPQDFQNLRADRSDSALDHRHRLTFEVVYDIPFFKNRNWFAKNIIGNWEFSPIYTYQSGNWATVQSKQDSDLNGDSFTDRAVVNPRGGSVIGSGVTPIDLTGATVPAQITDADGNKLTNPAIAAYVANNPNAQYVTAGVGVYPTVARNTLRMPAINNLDLTALKRFSLTERFKVEFLAQFSNTLNHPQYIGGFLNDITSNGQFTTDPIRSYLDPSSSKFNRSDLVFSSNPRVLTLALKLRF